MYKQFLIIGLSTLLSFNLKAQDTWPLEKCILHAQDNSRTIKQNQIQIKDAKLLKKQSDYDRYPSVSGSSSYGLNFGRSINPSTYSFENRQSSFNSFGINAGATLYNGGRITNTIKQSEVNVKVAEADLEQAASSIELQVAQAYLQILLNEEQLENARKRVQTSQSQLDRVQKQISAGQVAPNARFDLQAQVARDEQQVVTASNNVEIAYLNLKNLLEISPETVFKIEKPKVVIPTESNPDGYSFKAIYTQALSTQPIIKSDELRIKSAEIGVKIAEANLKPVLSISGGLSTNYSSSILDFTKTEGKPEVKYTPPVPIKINGVDAQLQTPFTTGLTNPKSPFFKQVGDNLGQGLNLNLQIPIFDGYSRKIGVQRQKLNVENQGLLLERDKQQLKSDVQNAIASARAAKKEYESAMKTLEAQKAAFESVEKRLQVGSANSFEYTQARNNLDTAERDVTVSKYNYLFRLKIIDFYEGKKISLK